eukprot:TRINITY_DN4198_c0_g2_i1.p1 TRINITY_DN4198_c0_g2~~TRINITY_DN4198_c0_g2_i1.p1  ORF type:complete len:192 (-),score=46.56 TRINITY_DN4198_c0_g2_i1:293-868(-)
MVSSTLSFLSPRALPTLNFTLNWNVLEKTISFLETAITTEGLFRLSGSSEQANEILFLMKSGNVPQFSNYNVHCVTSALKIYLQDLPEPFIPDSLFHVVAQALKNDDLPVVIQTISKMEEEKRKPLISILKFLRKVHENSEVNKMTTKNLSIIFSAVLFKPNLTSIEALLSLSGLQAKVLVFLIGNAEHLH